MVNRHSYSTKLEDLYWAFTLASISLLMAISMVGFALQLPLAVPASIPPSPKRMENVQNSEVFGIIVFSGGTNLNPHPWEYQPGCHIHSVF
jgi:hypothetical protein